MAIQKCDVNPLVNNLTIYLIRSMLITFELGGVILASTHLAFFYAKCYLSNSMTRSNVICKL